MTDYSVKGDRDDLVAAMSPVAKRSAKAHSNDALKALHLVSKDGATYAEASNGVITARASVQATATTDVDVLIPPRAVDAVKAMAAGEVELGFEGTVLTITGTGRGRYELNLPSGQWPSIDVGTSQSWDDVQEVEADDIIKALDRASTYASSSVQKPDINGVNAKPDLDDQGQKTGMIRLSATDSFRLYQRSVPGPERLFGEEDVTVPVALIDGMEKFFKGAVKMAANDNLFFVASSDGSRYMSIRRIAGKYPKVEGLFPKPDDIKFQVQFPRDAMLDAIKKASVMGEGTDIVELRFAPLEIGLHVKSERGYSQEYIMTETGIDDMVMGFNVGYLKDGLKAFSSDELTLQLINPIRPAVFRADGEPTVYLLMPVRIPNAKEGKKA